MATVKVIKTTFQFKRGQSDAWKSLNPILAAGEPGYELDTHKFKIGDGKTPWNSLEYINDDSSSLKDIQFVSKEQIQTLF